MFEPGTVLVLREPQSTDEKPFAYDRVQVVGQSPVQHASSGPQKWAGTDAVGVILQPLTGFDSNIDEPYGRVNELYEVESFPDEPAVGDGLRPRNIPPAPSPEQVFAQQARDQAADQVTRRQRVPQVQANDKTPEQVLREKADPAKAQPRRRKAPANE